MLPLAFARGLPLPQHNRVALRETVSRRMPVAPRKRRARITVNMDDGGEASDSMTCGDAFREWILARDRGEGVREAPDSRSCAAGRVDVLFVGRDNSTVSVAAEAIFTDLCERRSLECFTSHSVGTNVAREGEPPERGFVEALHFKRGIDVSRKMACKLDKNDLESYSVIVCMDEHTRSELLYMVADENGRFNEAEEDKVVVLSSYCSNPKLQSLQFRSGSYARDQMNFLMSALVDACNGLLVSLMESPPVPPA